MMKNPIKLQGRREIKKEQSRQAIIAAAQKCFEKNGIKKTSIMDITTKANLAVGTFYNYFESKEALLLSFIYKLTLNEVIVYFIPLVIAFVYGIILKRGLDGPEKRAVLIRKILIILIFLDLVLRLLPFRFNYSFAWYFVVIGCLVRAACLIFLILDLKQAAIQNGSNNPQ